jgi:hypothetical protein
MIPAISDGRQEVRWTIPTEPCMHPTQLPAHAIDRIVSRRGRLHGFESIEPHKTALV